MKSSSKLYTLITGASLGIGRSLAFECARRGMNLILIALPGRDLINIREAISRHYKVDAICFGIDLTQDEAPAEVFNFCRKNNLQVNILINNAGMGAGGLFQNIYYKQYLKMFRLNNQALVGLTYYFIRELEKHSNAHILNLSSLEAILPLPYKSVYAGTKNFTYSFSLTLREELKSSHIKVSVLCPGPTITNYEGLMRIKAHGKKSRIMVMFPKQVAQIAIKKMLQGQGIIVPGSVNYTLVRISWFIPVLTKMRILEKMFRVYRDMAPEPPVLDSGVLIN
ncbi:MAG: SDR family NAD(P)-dependent oxidoreductase [Candidatus Cyclobacteriaceae bacterium M3_2C_046]